MDKYTKPDFDKSALITIDILRDTLDGQPLEILGTSISHGGVHFMTLL